MEESKNHFESYLKRIINDINLEESISEILNSFSNIQLKKNDFFPAPFLYGTLLLQITNRLIILALPRVILFAREK